MSEIRPADPAARRRMLLAVGAAAILGMIALWFAPGALRDWLLADDAEPLARGAFLLRVLSLLISLSLLAPAVYWYVLAARIDSAGEFPPPNTLLVRDMRVLRGHAARGRAWLLRVIAIILALLALAAGVLTWLLASTLVS